MSDASHKVRNVACVTVASKPNARASTSALLPLGTAGARHSMPKLRACIGSCDDQPDGASALLLVGVPTRRKPRPSV